MMLKITPLGVGGAFTQKFYHNNYVFDFVGTGRKLLVDAGTTLRYSLPEAGFELTDITDIFITHLHSDHFGGIEEFLQKCYWRFIDGVHTPHKPKLWIPHTLFYNVKESLVNGLKTNIGTKFEDYFETIVQITPRTHVEIAPGFTFYTIDTTGLHIRGMNSYAFRLIRNEDQMDLVFTGDIGWVQSSDIHPYHTDYTTRMIFQDCQFYSSDDSVHTSFEQILNYYPKMLHDKIYLMHYGDDINDHVKKVYDNGLNIVRQGVPIIID
jgi:hydroxyacylglutathione hydrolase